MPYGLVVDKFRWDIFSGLPEEKWNERWTELRLQYQGISSPTDLDGFNAAGNKDILTEYRGVDFFIGNLLSFQLHASFCKSIGEYEPNNSLKPLHKCNIDKYENIGIEEALQAGSSKHWSEVLFQMTGERAINANGFLEYFKPLSTFLEQENNRRGK